MVREHGYSERRACRLVSQPRSSQRYRCRRPDPEAALVAQMRALAMEYPRWGYRRVAARLRARGWPSNHKRIERLWRQEGLQIRRPARKRRRRSQAHNGCTRYRPTHAHHVWSIDFAFDRTEAGRPLKILSVLDEWTRQSLRLKVGYSLVGADVGAVLRSAVSEYGPPSHVRCDNGPEFISRVLRRQLSKLGVEPLHIEPGSPWENGYGESFIGKLRDELLSREVFGSRLEAQVLLDEYREHYNHDRPHSALGYRSPALFAKLSGGDGSASLRRPRQKPSPCVSTLGS
ncbi:MAG: IS3 family transposase [Thiotrichales bacterium]|nr:IS3 family transposase [Thiotrichales bacterium]